MVNISLPPDFNRETHVESIRQRLWQHSYWRAWINFIVNNYRAYVSEAANLGQRLGLLKNTNYKSSLSPYQIVRRIYNDPRLTSLAAYDIQKKRYLISLKNIFSWISTAYRVNPREYIHITNSELKRMAYHETGHMILDQHLRKPVLDLATSIFHEAFAEYYTWWTSRFTGDPRYINYLQNYIIPRASRLFEPYPTAKQAHPEELSMNRLLNYYLGDPHNQLLNHRNRLQNLKQKLRELYKALYGYKFSKDRSSKELSVIKAKLQDLIRTMEHIQYSQEELGFLLLEGKRNVVRGLLRETHKLAKAIKAFEQKKDPGFLDILKLTYRSAKFYLSYRKFVNELTKSTENYRKYQYTNKLETVARILYRKLMRWPYGYKEMISLNNKQFVVVKLPDVGHAVGLRLAYRWLLGGQDPRGILEAVSKDPELAWRVGYREFVDWIRHIYNKWYVMTR
jgi:hypothetical protein